MKPKAYKWLYKKSFRSPYDESVERLIDERIGAITARDRYGQRRIFDQRLNALFPEPELQERVKRHIESGESKYQISTYSGDAGQYKAITLAPTWREKSSKRSRLYLKCPNCGFEGGVDEFTSAITPEGREGYACIRCDYVFSLEEGDAFETRGNQQRSKHWLTAFKTKTAEEGGNLGFEWRKSPEVSPGGKGDFYVTNTDRGRIWVVWDRTLEAWTIRDEDDVIYPYAGNYSTPTAAKKAVERQFEPRPWDAGKMKETSKTQSACDKLGNTKREWVIDKRGNLELVGMECKTKAAIVIRDVQGTIIDEHVVDKDGHSWREVIAQGVWQTKFTSMDDEDINKKYG